MRTTTVDSLLDAAETRIRAGGFHKVSFRDLADDLGIKSASVHYHFRRKEDLGIAVVNRYAGRFFDNLEAAASGAQSAREAVSVLTDIYRTALFAENKPCLCGVMGAESPGLPEPVAVVVGQFLEGNIAWLANRLELAGLSDPRARASTVVAALQGAMMLSVTLGQTDLFEAASDRLGVVTEVD